MPISRMQNPRQLYGLGSFVKKITRPLKKVFKSPIGKAAMLGLGAYGLGGGFGAGGFKFGNILGSWNDETRKIFIWKCRWFRNGNVYGKPRMLLEVVQIGNLFQKRFHRQRSHGPWTWRRFGKYDG